MGGRGSSSGIKPTYEEFNGTKKNYSDILDAIKKSGLSDFGIRVSQEERNIGAYFNLSEDMEYGGKLDGTSTIGLISRYGMVDKYSDTDEIREAVQKALKLAESYSGKHISIVGGDDSRHGSDEGEYVIGNDGRRRRGAKLIYKIK